MNRIIVGGQSNAINNALGMNIFSTTGRVHIKFFIENPSEWVVPTPENPIDRGAAWIKLGDLIVEKTGRDVYIEVVAKGSTTSTDWEAGLNSELIREALIFKPDAIFWVQGEGDAQVNTPMLTYYNFVKRLIQSCDPEIRWYVAVTSVYNQYVIGSQTEVNAAQKAIIGNGFARGGPDIDEMRRSFPDHFTTDLVHFHQYRGHLAFATEWRKKVL